MTFQVIPPDNTVETNDRNWRNYQQNIRSGSWNPTGISGGSYPTVSGTNPIATAFYRVTADNICFWNITWSVTSGSVTVAFPSSSYVVLPYAFVPFGAPGLASSTNNSFLYSAIPLLPSNGAPVGWLTYQNWVYGSPLAQTHGTLFSNNGSTITATANYVSLQGWYFVGK
jgi:hypothetical protein